MRFEPRSREEMSSLLPDGVYKAIVRNAVEKDSRNGNPMIALELEIYDSEGRQRIVRDNLILMDSMMWKLLGFCESAGLMNEYNMGELRDASCVNAEVHCKVVQKPPEGDFPAKNEVKSYCLPPKGAKATPKPAPPPARKTADRATVPPASDDVPF